MSSAVFPLGMSSYNNRTGQQQYIPWKGVGPNSFPVGTVSSNIRPLTNNDIGNNFGGNALKARPIKHYRKGRVTPVEASDVLDYRVLNRQVRSSVSASLGGGAGGRGVLGQMVDSPGSFAISTESDCINCKALGAVATYKPNTTYITENPIPDSLSCCNAQKKALRRVRPANTNLPKNYYTTLQQYRQNRCLTYDQRAFNFVGPVTTPESNAYYGQCYPDAPNGTCKVVIYKPNNKQFAQEGAVSSSTYTLKQNVVTIEKNIAGYNRAMKIGPYLPETTPYLYKNKSVLDCNQNSLIYMVDGRPPY